MNIKVDNVTKIIKKAKFLIMCLLEFESGEITGLKGINGSGKDDDNANYQWVNTPHRRKGLYQWERIKKEMDFPESIGVLIDSPAFLDGYSAYDNLSI